MRYWEIKGVPFAVSNEEMELISHVDEKKPTLSSLDERDELLAFRLISRGILTHDEDTDIVSVVSTQEVSWW